MPAEPAAASADAATSSPRDDPDPTTAERPIKRTKPSEKKVPGSDLFAFFKRASTKATTRCNPAMQKRPRDADVDQSGGAGQPDGKPGALRALSLLYVESMSICISGNTTIASIAIDPGAVSTERECDPVSCIGGLPGGFSTVEAYMQSRFEAVEKQLSERSTRVQK